MRTSKPGALLSAFSVVASTARAYELLIPALEFKTGFAAPVGIPLWTGFSDYFTLLNERDGGIKGVKIKIATCETGFDTKRGVECYEKLKAGAAVIVPGTTGIAYELTPKTTVDRIPIVSTGTAAPSDMPLCTRCIAAGSYPAIGHPGAEGFELPDGDSEG